MIRVFFSLIVGLSVLATTSHAQSNKRKLTDRDDLYGWEAVGRLDMGDGSFCTGTLIAQDMVLTAAHCAVDQSTGTAFAGEDITFRAGLSNGKALAERQVTQVAIHPNYGSRPPLSRESVRIDVALLRLDKPIPYSVADPFALYSGRVLGDEVSIASYGRGRSEAITRERSCRIIDRRQGLILFNCDITFGSSGSAILTKKGSRWQILSVVSAVGTNGSRKVGFGMELGEIVAELKAIMRRDAPQPKASIRRLQVGSGKSASGAKFISSGGG
ncbi:MULTISPECIES: serine protease [unclassified Ruegeria]|uniref:trypsin-like serine peptidase n=1 Tax=unclassified Ruegeria TaxID=2625375 RepID=UPI001490D2B6|nr:MULTISPECIES: trypsin-like serine protease [unclassified Ruegeria]NOD49320.1 trypsin-like serine protease [Ruegeria sp. HKCCD5849]NOD53381.1 trypsin-like serine protease [Ruegeria sp. HKCCD5851]NOD69705.1 trypsin-like serine protease [Ruegeria sp. HKCCD7303]